MSKFLKIPNGDYHIKVQNGGTITLDVGTDISGGKVIISGDLEVQGETTTVNTTELEVEDNIIRLNTGNTSGVGDQYSGIRTSGIEFNRGSNLANPQFIFDEDLEDRIYGLPGMLQATEPDGRFSLGLVTNYLDSKGQDIYLYNSGLFTVKVDPNYSYEQQVFTYSDPLTNSIDVGLGATDDDTIPNTKAIVDYIDSYFAGIFQDRIEEGTLTKTFVEALDREETGNPSKVVIGVDDIVVAEFEKNKIELNDLRIFGTRIETTLSDSDLILCAAGSGSVRLDDTLHLNSIPGLDDTTQIPDPEDPTGVATIDGVLNPDDGLKLYVSNRNLGGTGLFFAHADGTRDEIISNNRTLVYSMLF